MKIQELLKGKVLDSDRFKIGESEVHVIYIADNQKLIDKFKMDVISPGVPLEFATKTTIRVKVTLKPCQGDAFGDIGITHPKTISFFYDPHKTTIPQELVTCKVLAWENIYENEPNNVTSMRVTVECGVLDKDKFIHNLYHAVMFLREPREVALFVSKCEIIDSNEIPFSPTTKESYDGSLANPQAMDEVGTMPSIYVKADYETMNRDNCLASIKMLHDYIDKLQKEKCDLETTYFTHLPPDIKKKFLDDH